MDERAKRLEVRYLHGKRGSVDTAGIVWLRLGVVLSYSRLLWLLGLYRTQTMAVVSAG